MNRINHLDGLRGIAILMVILFHAYTRWSDIVPYGDTYSELPIFRYGYLGVQLFFLISGFVILMTLEKCDGIRNFIYRRWLRLFPAMLICSLIVFVTAGLFQYRPLGQPNTQDLIPGLTFIEPYIWLKVTGLEFDSLEGSFWSLYVEFKFYVIAALLYFFIGSKKLVYALFICFLAWLISSQVSAYSSASIFSALHSITDLLSFKYFGWFAAGAAYYLYTKHNQVQWLVIGVIFSLISSCVESSFELGALIAALFVSLLFYVAITNSKAQAIMSNKVFLFFGFISYPLYLLHENMMISITIMLDNYLTSVPSAIYPILAVAFISVLAYLVAKKLESLVKKGLISVFSYPQLKRA